ncbi:MAG: CotH kinase family protein [Clostridia bacterium]|nr:CotH kinase family protein [Clostridia bacterium]
MRYVRPVLMVITAVLLLCVLLACGEAAQEQQTHTHVWTEVTIPATCEREGYSASVCDICGMKRDETHTEPAGHSYELTEEKEATFLEDGCSLYTCSVCGKTEEVVIPSVTHDIPKVYLQGDLDTVTASNRIPFQMTYVSSEQDFSCIAALTVQGGSSAVGGYSKLNYNIRLFDDEELEVKHKVDLGWGKESKYCLKANFVDSTQARNIVTARLWTEMVQTRQDVPEQLDSAPGKGAVDGFPVIVVVNGEFYGLYTWNIPKDEWMFNIHGSDTGAVLFASNWNDPVKFKTPSAMNDSEWVLKYESEDLAGKTYPRLNELIRFLASASDEEFLAHIEEYVDIPSVIDYIILITICGAGDNTSKNALMVTYDGLKFYMSVYDLDATWSLHWTGKEFSDDEKNGPLLATDKSSKTIVTSASNQLFKRVLQHYSDLLAERFLELREGVLSNRSIYKAFEDFVSRIPQQVYEADWEAHPDVPSTKENTVSRIRTYARKRMALLDGVIAAYKAIKPKD